MDLIEEHNRRYEFFRDITGVAMLIHRKYKPGLLESAYEAALEYLLTQKGYTVERQVYLPIYWEDVMLEQTYRMDLVVNEDIIIELKAVSHVDTSHRRQLWNYMNLTHLPYGMIINFGSESLYSEWYHRNDGSGIIDRVKLL
jgi:GxxExxY protein